MDYLKQQKTVTIKLSDEEGDKTGRKQVCETLQTQRVDVTGNLGFGDQAISWVAALSLATKRQYNDCMVKWPDTAQAISSLWAPQAFCVKMKRLGYI
jgi:hypothetical protein